MKAADRSWFPGWSDASDLMERHYEVTERVMSLRVLRELHEDRWDAWEWLSFRDVWLPLRNLLTPRPLSFDPPDDFPFRVRYWKKVTR